MRPQEPLTPGMSVPGVRPMLASGARMLTVITKFHIVKNTIMETMTDPMRTGGYHDVCAQIPPAVASSHAAISA